MQTSLKRCGLKFSSRKDMSAKCPRERSSTFFSLQSIGRTVMLTPSFFDQGPDVHFWHNDCKWGVDDDSDHQYDLVVKGQGHIYLKSVETVLWHLGPRTLYLFLIDCPCSDQVSEMACNSKSTFILFI